MKYIVIDEIQTNNLYYMNIIYNMYMKYSHTLERGYRVNKTHCHCQKLLFARQHRSKYIHNMADTRPDEGPASVFSIYLRWTNMSMLDSQQIWRNIVQGSDNVSDLKVKYVGHRRNLPVMSGRPAVFTNTEPYDLK